MNLAISISATSGPPLTQTLLSYLVMLWLAPGLTIVTLFSTALPSYPSPNSKVSRMLWSESCCRKTLQLLPLHSLIVCTGSLFTPESVSKSPQSLTSPYTHNLPATLIPCSTNNCQSETSVHPTHCFFLPTGIKQILACMSFILLHQSSGTNYQ